MVKISTSILGIKDTLDNDLEKVINSKTDYIHLDIMDGIYVENKTFKFNQLSILKKCKKKLDIHLMVDDIVNYIEEYKNLNPEYITIHVENDNVIDLIKLIKSNNIKVGVAIKIDTDIEKVYDILKYVDLVLIMSVKIGYSGQNFDEHAIEKIEKLKDYINKNNYSTIISVDGGINKDTSKLAIKAGASMLVCGSYITNSDNYDGKIDELLK